MGNRAKRVEVARELKKQRLGKLYQKGSKKTARRVLSAGQLDAPLNMLRSDTQFKLIQRGAPGLIVRHITTQNTWVMKY